MYLAALTLFVGLMWAEYVGRFEGYYGGSDLYRISRMSEAGKTIIASIVCFQFGAAHLLAVVLLSNAVSDEVVHRTLGVLLSTPITSLQVVLGKLLSKMLQLTILLAISLPLLAVVRVFGGVPWDYVLAALAVTLSSALFSASVSLLLSVYSRRSYVVIFATALVGGVLYLLLPWLAYMILHEMLHAVSESEFITPLMHVNPFLAMAFMSDTMISPRSAGGVAYSWPLGCAIALGGSGLVLAWATAAVRKVTLRQAAGGAPKAPPGGLSRAPSSGLPREESSASRWPAGKDAERHRLAGGEIGAGTDPSPERFAEGRIRRVRGSPIVWKELHMPLFPRRVLLALGITALEVLLITYALVATAGDLADRDTQVVYSVVFTLLGTLWTAILSASVITTEKEARSWPILLLTPLSEWHILLGKAAGVLRRVLPVWGLLMGHVLLFSFCGFIHPSAILHLALVMFWVVVLLTCSGLYFSARFGKTTTAVIMNLGLAVLLWAAVPFVSYMIEEGHALSDFLLSGNPVVQVTVVVKAAANPGRGYLGVYDWPEGYLHFAETTARIFLWTVWNVLLGFLFLYLAKTRLRRRAL